VVAADKPEPRVDFGIGWVAPHPSMKLIKRNASGALRQPAFLLMEIKDKVDVSKWYNRVTKDKQVKNGNLGLQNKNTRSITQTSRSGWIAYPESD
jgi:hypothetical protein